MSPCRQCNFMCPRDPCNFAPDITNIRRPPFKDAGWSSCSLPCKLLRRPLQMIRPAFADWGSLLPSAEQLNSTTVCPSVSVPLDESQRVLLPLATPSVSEGCNSLDTQGPSQAKPPVVAECLTSSGPISAAAMLLGWDAAPVGPRRLAAAKTPLINLDVSNSAQLQALLNFDRTAIVDWWHVHLFLKSCSRARGSAPACRDADNLFGCQSLSDSAAAQVLHDNQLCQAVTSILFRAYESKALVSLVGPARSWCWSVLAKCVKTRVPSAFVDWYFNLADQELDTCMYGSPFVTSLLVKASAHAFHGLSLSCDKSHSHRAWTPPHSTVNHFCDMSLPSQLCQAFCAKATQACLTPKAHKPAELRCRRLRAQVRSAAANQPHYLPSLIPEFKLKLPLAQVPATADFKLLSRTPGSDTGELDEPESATKRFKAAAKGDGSRGSSDRDAVALDMAGVYHTMEEHLELACALSCPADTSERVPDQLRKNIFAVLTEGPVSISKKRMLALQSLNDQLAQLESTEKELRQKMHPDVDSVTKGKALSLFRQLLEETKFPDLSVLDLLEGGVPLVGQEVESPLFSKRPKPKEIEPEQLSAQAALRRQALQRMKGLTSEQDYAAMKAETAEEVAAGFLTGPYRSEREVSDLLQTDDWSLSPRFLLRQGEDSKIRIIDDFKMSAVNRAFGSSSFLELQDTDYAVGLLRFPSRVLQDRSKVRVPLSDGTTLEGDWSREMLSCPALLGKTLDLSKAYRQDYTIYEFKPAASLLDKVLMRLLDLLGWTYAKAGRKFVAFDAKVVSLGVSLGLGELWSGVLTVENKPGRLEKISHMLRAIASGKDVSRSEVASLHGLLNFAGGLILGFELKPTARMLSRALSGPFLGNTPELKQACASALDVIAQCRPKRCPASISPPIILYTDGAYEKGIGTWGAVLIDELSGARWAFGGTVDSSLVAHWKREAGEQVICQVEAFALAIVLYGIRGSVKGRSILAFIDNDPCRYGFIKRYSPSTSLLRVISLVALLEGSLEALLWFERVPSKSNPADLPSRAEIAEACARFKLENKGDIALTSTMKDFLWARDYEPVLARAILESARLEADWTEEVLQ
ncbi:unnamed protein product [Symbiodinium sp. CCMP2456]|nr:unnamed protein product [Symbiodinium sp. CCMP2456]